MRALLPLLVAAAVALPPPALLVLRAACPARDPAAFAPAAALEHRARRPLRLLGYADTCGAGWSTVVAREALATVSGGGAVTVAGWPGAATCDALSAAARALRVSRPAVCALPTARAAAVARLAARLGWRRAVLPPSPPRSECHAALQEVARSLATAGITTVALAPLTSDELTLLSHVVILCASRSGGAGGAAGAALAAAAGAVLLLHVDELDLVEPAPSPDNAGGGATTTDDYSILDSRAFVGDRENFSKRVVGAIRKKIDFRTVTIKSNNISQKSRSELFATEALTVELRTPKLKKRSSDNETDNESELNGSIRGRRRPNYLFSYIDRSLPQPNLLLLSGDRLDEDQAPRNLEQVYVAALESVERATNAERTRTETAEFTFFLYRRSNEGPAPAWSLVGSADTTSHRSLDDTREWVTEVRVDNATEAFERLAGSQLGARRRRGGTGAGAATLSAGAGVAVAAAAALAARWVASRRRRRRRGGGVVLSPAEFSFPGDERCVGEGMEAMLSCWLQQLHEFGGPAPSAPSSTCSVNLAPDRLIRYKGDTVHVKPLTAAVGPPGHVGGPPGPAGGVPGSTAGPLVLKRKAVDVLLVMQSLRHENLNPFIGCLCSVRPALVWEQCSRGSLEDVLKADDIKLDWTFRLSLLTDAVRGMRYLHSSPLRVHGRLSSRNCAVDARWVLRLTDYGAGAFSRAQQLPAAARPARDLLWTAPELLRDPRARPSQPADVYSFAIIMQEVIVRGEPYCMLALSPDELVEKLSRPPPLIRPSVSMGAAPPEAVSLMRQCWSEAPDLRPDFHRLHDLFRQLHRGRKINIVDSMFEMLEKYSNNLEELIKERTEQLDMEKKKTEQLLNRMLPRSVAERLLVGCRVEPEEFSDVSIYFSDIVGFTALAARSTPVQVVDLLNDLYTTFDAAIERYRVYKVETIGDAYMVVGGLPARAPDHAEAVATMALHLLHLAGRFRVRHLPDTPLRLRIGLHSGPCCAGVVGLTMPRYCLFGDTVNTASRMESTGAAWRIQVSAATADRLAAAGGYRLRSRGLVMIKGKGVMHTYWLLGKDGFDKPLPTPPPLESEEVLFETDGENESERSSDPPSASTPGPEPAPAVSGDRWSAGGGGAVLRRQWSLERGEALAAAAAAAVRPADRDPPLALLAPPPAPRAPLPPRYRTRPDPP